MKEVSIPAHVIQRRAIVSVPGTVVERCWGKRVASIEDRHLKDVCLAVAKEFIRRLALLGELYRDSEDVHIYGPYPSAERLATMLTGEEFGLDRRLHGQLVLERAASPEAFAHYLLVANFNKRTVGEDKPKLILPAHSQGVTDGIPTVREAAS